MEKDAVTVYILYIIEGIMTVWTSFLNLSNRQSETKNQDTDEDEEGGHHHLKQGGKEDDQNPQYDQEAPLKEKESRKTSCSMLTQTIQKSHLISHLSFRTVVIL